MTAFRRSTSCGTNWGATSELCSTVGRSHSRLADLDAILPLGRRRVVNWRHNLDSGAQPILLGQGDTRDACVQIAVKAAKAIEIRFGSIDVVRVDGSWKILEINSGVMMESLSKSHPDLVYTAYNLALDKVFD